MGSLAEESEPDEPLAYTGANEKIIGGTLGINGDVRLSSDVV